MIFGTVAGVVGTYASISDLLGKMWVGLDFVVESSRENCRWGKPNIPYHYSMKVKFLVWLASAFDGDFKKCL